MYNGLIDRRLENTAKILQAAVGSNNDGIGLLKGKTGTAIFFYLYAGYSGDKDHEVFADGLMDTIMEGITENTPLGYSEGLTGFGVGLEYLVKEGYIEADTDEILEDLDILINDILKASHNVDVFGFGKYLASRLRGRHNGGDIPSRNIESAGIIMNMLDKAYTTYPEAFGALDLLSDMARCGIDPPKTKAYINYAIDKVETMVYEDVHFGNYPGAFNPLGMAVKLIHAAESTADSGIMERASFFLEKYEPGFRKYLENGSSGLIAGSFKWGVLYDYLGFKLKNEEYSQISGEWIERSLEKEELFDSGYAGMPSMSALDGYAGIGLSLLGFTGAFSEWSWLNIIPVYREIDKIIA